MSITLNDTTPSAVAGGQNVKWQSDMSGNVSAYVPNLTNGVNTQTTTYSIVAGDNGKLIDCNGATAFTITLLGSGLVAGNAWVFHNRNVGAVTLNRNSLTIDGKSQNLILYQGDAVLLVTDGSNYFTGSPRPFTVGVFKSGTDANGDVLLYAKMDRPCIFPASAPNSFAVANTAATGSTTYTFKKNGSSFATVAFAGSGTTGTWTQASDASFSAGDILELDGPATADATLANIGFTLQGYRF